MSAAVRQYSSELALRSYLHDVLSSNCAGNGATVISLPKLDFLGKWLEMADGRQVTSAFGWTNIENQVNNAQVRTETVPFAPKLIVGRHGDSRTTWFVGENVSIVGYRITRLGETDTGLHSALNAEGFHEITQSCLIQVGQVVMMRHKNVAQPIPEIEEVRSGIIG